MRNFKIFIAGLLLTFPGCGYVPSLLKKSASFYLGCPAEQITYTQISTERWGVAGCNQRFILGSCRIDTDAYCPVGDGVRE